MCRKNCALFIACVLAFLGGLLFNRIVCIKSPDGSVHWTTVYGLYAGAGKSYTERILPDNKLSLERDEVSAVCFSAGVTDMFGKPQPEIIRHALSSFRTLQNSQTWRIIQASGLDLGYYRRQVSRVTQKEINEQLNWLRNGQKPPDPNFLLFVPDSDKTDRCWLNYWLLELASQQPDLEESDLASFAYFDPIGEHMGGFDYAGYASRRDLYKVAWHLSLEHNCPLCRTRTIDFGISSSTYGRSSVSDWINKNLLPKVNDEK